MPNEILRKTKVEFSFQSGVYAPTGNNDLSSGSPAVVDLSLDRSGVGMADGTAVNSDQVDFGVTRFTLASVKAALEWFAAVSAGLTVDFYWSPSMNSGVGVGNPGGPDGIDGPYAPSGFTVAEGVAQMLYIGSHRNNGELGVQIAQITPPEGFPMLERFGQLIVFNNSGATVCLTDDIESSVLFAGEILEIAADT